ncbi:DUF3253 domain-containing protein [Glutamicibacter protophormiae]|uniref:DUF3253 domain-containing protein n=1 Tax=Glutamicibacter protophormiae TaxID=37930 RepID=UPI0019578197|nr:DUF3253 domain-containing protein [Glutamicibacter protophormiae]QRQ78200.1 DUF3253 domain-containing protein [Glutamicibacter protophormiae]
MDKDQVAERTEDGRYLVISGRKWRASDPGIPPKLRQELVDELMNARREVGRGNEEARIRVHQAKLALGEHGQPWWEEPREDKLNERIRATIFTLLGKRQGSSICPSDVARVVGGEGERWRLRMDAVRQIAASLAADGALRVTQHGQDVDLHTVRGPVRLHLTGMGPAEQERSEPDERQRETE